MQLNIDKAFELLGYHDTRQQKIKNLYNQPHRKYHNIKHINNMLRWVEPHDRLHTLLECIIYHDLQYTKKVSPPGLNEAMSISLYMINKLKMFFDSEPSLRSANIDQEIISVTEAINATAHHDKDQKHLSFLTQLVLDLDLQSFGQSREEFLEDSHNIRLELGDKTFLKGGKKFLQTLLKRKQLFYLKTDWEDQARSNISWRIKNMKEVPH